MNHLLNRLIKYSDDELKIAAWNNATGDGDGSTYRIDCDGRYIRR